MDRQQAVQPAVPLWMNAELLNEVKFAVTPNPGFRQPALDEGP